MKGTGVRKSLVLGLSATVALLALFTFPGGAGAGISMGLKIRYAFPSQEVKVAYKSNSLKRGTRLVLQRTYGTRHRFRKVRKLKSTNGRFKAFTFKAPSAMGRYWYRVVATSKKGRFRGKSPVRGLTVLDTVPLERMVSYPVSRTVQVGSSLFRYAWYDTSLNRNGDTILRMDKTSCRALTIEAIGKDNEDAEVWLGLVQETGDPSTTNFRTNQLVTAGMGLSGDAFVLRMGSSGYSVDGYVNGFGLCFTKNGKLPRQ